MSKVSKRTKRIAITTSVMLALGGGAAIAYWSAVGTAAGTTAAAGTATAFAVTSGTATGGTMAPGSNIGQSVPFTVTNNNSGVQRLTNVTAVIATNTGAEWSSQAAPAKPACTANDFIVGDATIVGDYGNIAAGESKSGTVTVTMRNLDTNQDNCQGIAIPLYFTAK